MHWQQQCCQFHVMCCSPLIDNFIENSSKSDVINLFNLPSVREHAHSQFLTCRAMSWPCRKLQLCKVYRYLELLAA